MTYTDKSAQPGTGFPALPCHKQTALRPDNFEAICFDIKVVGSWEWYATTKRPPPQ